MKTLSRYILSKHVGPFFFGFATIMFIFLSNYLIEKIPEYLSKDVALTNIVEIVVLSLGWTFALVVPMSVLIATLMAFGKMAADNEITAMKASGYGVHRAMVPLLAAAVVLTAGLVYFNNNVLPDSNFRLELLLRDIGLKNPSLEFEPGVFSDESLIPDYSIQFQEIDSETNTGYGVTIFDYSDKGMLRTVIAEKATLHFDRQNAIMRVELFDGESHEVDTKTWEEYRLMPFERSVINIPYKSSELKRSESGSRSDRSQTIAMMRQQIAAGKEQIAERYKLITQRAEGFLDEETLELPGYPEKLFALEPGDFNRRDERYHIKRAESDTLLSSVDNNYRLVGILRTAVIGIDRLKKQEYRLLVEIHKKYAIPFSCIIFVLVGVPLGVKSRRGDIAVSGGMSMFFFLLYWLLLHLGEELADRRLIAAWLSMWLANILVGTGGLALTWLMIRESTLLDIGPVNRFFYYLRRKQERQTEAAI